MENVLSYYIRSLCKVLLIAFISFLVGCIDASKHNLSVMELDDCKNIIIEEPYHNHRIHKINNNLDKRKILNILHKKSAYELCKVPPKIIITIEGKIHNEGYIICGKYIKDYNGTTYKYDIDIEKELCKIVYDE